MAQQLKITGIKAREIIDCRGEPTLRVNVWVDGVRHGWADVPAGRSTGTYEAFEMRDGGTRYDGFGVLKAIANVNDIIAREIVGMTVTEQRKIDEAMIALDGTAQKKNLGANAILGASLACARAAAEAVDIPLYRYLNSKACILPVPMMNLVNGGKLTANYLDFQEFIIMPVGAESFAEALQITCEINTVLRGIIEKKYGRLALNVGDEGGFAPPMKKIREAMDVLVEAVAKVGWTDRVVYAYDVAATHLYNKKTKKYTVEGEQLTADQMIDLFKGLLKEYPIRSIEDPIQEDDFKSFAKITQETGIQIVGDDLFVTTASRLKKGIAAGSANALLWKYNQVGTLTEAMDVAEIAFRNGYGICVSERSGETEDPYIADCVVALGAGQIKTGAPVRSERTCKYNRLLEIEEELGKSARYAGWDFRRPV